MKLSSAVLLPVASGKTRLPKLPLCLFSSRKSPESERFRRLPLQVAASNYRSSLFCDPDKNLSAVFVPVASSKKQSAVFSIAVLLGTSDAAAKTPAAPFFVSRKSRTGAFSAVTASVFAKLRPDESGSRLKLPVRSFLRSGQKFIGGTFGSCVAAALLLCACAVSDTARLAEARRLEREHDPAGSYAICRKLFEENGNPEAAFLLGNLSRRNTPDHPAEYANALFYYSAAAEKEHPGALFALADMHEHGLGVPEDRGKALELYCRSAGAGSPEARLRASEICFTDPVLGDAERGIRLLEEGASQGDLRCMMRLASFYMGATNAAKRDEAKARALYEKTAERGVPEALYFLAVCDYLGIGCPKSPKSGLTRMKKAASSGSPEAWVFFSLLCEDRGRREQAEKYRAKARSLYGTIPFAGVVHVKLWNSFEEMERAVKSAFRMAYPRHY